MEKTLYLINLFDIYGELLDDKKKKDITYYLSNEYDMNMFDNKSYVNDKKENTSFKNYVDNVTNKVSIKALDWFKKHFSKALNKISSVLIAFIIPS